MCICDCLVLNFIARGNQRDRDRERAQARAGNKGKQVKDDGLTPEQRRERWEFGLALYVCTFVYDWLQKFKFHVDLYQSQILCRYVLEPRLLVAGKGIFYFVQNFCVWLCSFCVLVMMVMWAAWCGGLCVQGCEGTSRKASEKGSTRWRKQQWRRWFR